MFWKDFEKIRKNIIIFSNKLESKFKKSIRDKIKTLRENPYAYQRIENSNILRRFFIDKYVIIYRVNRNYITILRILPQKSNYKTENLDILKLKF